MVFELGWVGLGGGSMGPRVGGWLGVWVRPKGYACKVLVCGSILGRTRQAYSRQNNLLQKNEAIVHF